MFTLKTSQPSVMVFAFFSAIYVGIRYLHPFDFDWLIKIVPLCLLVFLWTTQPAASRKPVLLAALLFSLGGDILLSQKGLFLAGLGSFLIAQLSYAWLFSQQIAWQTGRMPLLIGLLIYLGTVAIYVVPHTGQLAVAIITYMCAITTMVALAFLRQAPHWQWVALGAALFLISDSLIAVSKFTGALVGYEAITGALIMATYYGAQGLIVFGYLAQSSEPKSMVYTS